MNSMYIIVKLKRAVKRLVLAEIEDTWKGAGHPEDYEAIEQDLVDARKEYEKIVKTLETKLKGSQ